MSNESIQAYQNADNFALAQRMAQSLAASTVVPTQYQNNIGNCLVALDVASRVGCSPFLLGYCFVTFPTYIRTRNH